MLTIRYLLLFFAIGAVSPAQAQLLISEIASANTGQVTDADNDQPDWFEVVNAGFTPLQIGGYSVSDQDRPGQWVFPPLTLPASSRILVFASGKNISQITTADGAVDHWETAIYEGQSWKYFTGTSAPPANWAQPGFSASAWAQGPGGFGYGDGDDATQISAGVPSVFIRRNFTLSDTALLSRAALSIDYDDGFIAYLNGVEIARSSNMPANTEWNTLSSGEREANLYSGGVPESFFLEKDQLKNLLQPGNNVLAVEVHNVTLTSSDLSARVWLHVGIRNTSVLFGPPPSWFEADDPDPGFTSSLHTNFKLSFGERLSLYNPQGALSDSVRVLNRPGHARMRLSDQGSWCYTDMPTPNTANGSDCRSGYAVAPTFSLAAGFYNGTQSLTLNAVGPIRYTLDGSEPGPGAPLYNTPLQISQTTVVRARCFLNNRLPSDVATATYFIDEPSTLPVVSVTIEPSEFDQVYTNFSEKGRVNVEYFDKNRQRRFHTQAAGYVVGNWSVGFPQKSLEFDMEEQFGARGDIRYPLFAPDKPIEALRSFRIRNEDDDFTGARMRDRIVNELAAPTHAGRAAYRNVVGFINGQYWGHFVARENLDPYFCRDNYGADPDSVNMVKTHYGIGDYVAVSGTTDDFFAMSDYIIDHPMDDPAHFAKAGALLDLDNFTDYFATEIYVASTDWLQDYFNNVRLFKSNKNDRWKFILWDVSYSSGNGSGCAGCNVLSSTISNPFHSRYGKMFNSLLENPEYQRFFINRFADLMNTAFAPARANALIGANAQELAPEIDRHHQRWDTGDLNHWTNQVNGLRDFYNQRPAFQREHLQQQFGLAGEVNITLQANPPGAGHIRISTITPENLPWTGVYFNGNPVQVSAIPAPGYTFSGWSANGFISDPANPVFTKNITENTTFTANFSGSPLEAAVYVREVNYNSDSTRNAGDWIELHNSGGVAVNISGWKIQDDDWFHLYTLPLGSSIPAGGSWVIVEDSSKFLSQHPGFTGFIGELGFDLSNAGDAVRVFDAFGAVVDTFHYDDANGWPCAADGFGRTLERTAPGTDPNDPDSWFAGCIGGSPGAAYSACQQDVYFSEINYNSDAAFDPGDWFELHNSTASALNLSGWSVRDQGGANLYPIPAGLNLGAGAYQVFYTDALKFNTLYPNLSNKTGPTALALSNAGDILRLYNQQGVLHHSVCFNDKLPWPEEADGQGNTLEASIPSANQALANNWFAGCYGGSPGAAYDPACPSVGTQTPELAGLEVYPNPASGMVTVFCREAAGALLEVSDGVGRVVWRQEMPAEGTALLPAAQWHSGWYVVHLRSARGQARVPLLIWAGK